MPRFSLILVVVAVCSLAFTPETQACDVPDGVYSIAIADEEVVLAPPGDVLVVLMEERGEGSVYPLEDAELTATATWDDQVVAGEGEARLVRSNYRVVITWETPLEPGDYVLDLQSDYDDVIASAIALRVGEPDSEAVPIVTKFEAREWQTGVDEVCCDLAGPRHGATPFRATPSGSQEACSWAGTTTRCTC